MINALLLMRIPNCHCTLVSFQILEPLRWTHSASSWTICLSTLPLRRTYSRRYYARSQNHWSSVAHSLFGAFVGMVLRPDPSTNGSSETTPVSSKQFWNNQAILLFYNTSTMDKNSMCGLYRIGCGSCHFRHQGVDLLKPDASFLGHSIRMTEEIIHSMCLPGYRPNLCRGWPSIETITTMSTIWNYDSLRNVCVWHS